MPPRWMIYGANGYTGELIARACAAEMRPVLAGRSRERIEPLARELGCEARVFEVRRPQLEGVSLVLHCAGPFIHTSGPMVRACLDAGAHYLDITGEIAVFESIMQLDDEAKRRGVTLLPGAGFDVVPTDCLAAMLARRLPGAVDLMLAFSGGRSVSAGTMKTMIEGIGQGGAVRRDGRIVRVPMLHDVREIPFPGKPRLAMTIPWGDVSTAYYTTGIPNIRVYRATSRRAVKRLRRIAPLLPLAALPPVKAVLKRIAARRAGPDAAERLRERVEVWGRVANASGDEVTMSMTTPEGYAFTVLSAIAAVKGILGEPPRGGSFTPAMRFGAEFVTAIPGVSLSG
ncbi:MAG TPA: saccharopine dehydrogenase NADP-binding domain-containing protein [Thermoanaerobaculia bacterium]|nr:saccharopine dehydrogenase NADP-binding domain-containing protein [Thermoanaerobaculia bacterium]